MRKVPVFIGYDVEDIIHPESDDALKRLLQIHNDTGLRATLYMVGEKARRLRSRGRKDVLDLITGHEIGYHGNFWFEFPHTAIVYGERLGWDDAVRKAYECEMPGLHDVCEITGQWPKAWVQHQGNWCPALAHMLRQAGLTAWNGWGHPGGPKFIMDTFAAVRGNNNISMQGSWKADPRDPIAPRVKPPCNAAADLREFQKNFDERMEGGKATHICVISHPTCWVTSEWWGWYEISDLVWRSGLRAPGAFPNLTQFPRVQMRSAADTEAAFEFTRKALEWIAKRKDVEVIPIAEYGRRVDGPRAQWITAAELTEAARAMQSSTDAYVRGELSLSPADLLFLIADSMAFAFENGRLPDSIQVKRVLGPIEEPLPAGPNPEMDRTAIWDTAREISSNVNQLGRLPTYGKSQFVYSLGQCALGLAQAYVRIREDGKTPDSVSVGEAGPLPKGGSAPWFDRLPLSLTGAPEPLLKEQMHKQMRWQSWSVRPALV